MHYRPLGKTGLSVSTLSFGAMRLPMHKQDGREVVNRELAIPMIHRAFESGVNYIDTAVGYCNQDSQRVVGAALKGWRDRIIVSTKNPYYGTDEKAWWQNLEDSLTRLQVEYIDIYNHHGIGWKSYTEQVEPVMSKWMIKARDEGLIRHICVSFHDDLAGLKKLVATGYPEVITLQYNMIDQSLAEGIALAHEKGIGVVVMGPVGGGRLLAETEQVKIVVPGIERMPELALRFVLSNPNVSSALSGMSTLQQVEENLAVAAQDRTLTPAEATAVEAHMGRLKKMMDLYCTACCYCLPCPQKINIPWLLGQYNQARIYGLWPFGRDIYRWYQSDPNSGPVSACTACRQCEEKCPQKIAIVDQLKIAAEALKSDR